MNKKYLFKSERLGFRTWTDEDLLPFAMMNKDPSVMEFFPNTLSAEETKAFIGRIENHFAEYGYGWYAIDTLEEGAFIGFIGLVQTRFEAFFTPCVEIGWRLKKEAWNKGYAREGAKRCLEFGFNNLGFSVIYSFTAAVNTRSEKVMQKIGMTKVGTFEHPNIEKGHWLRKHLLYEKKN